MPDTSADLVKGAASTSRFLTFRLDQRLYALPTEEVAEVIRVPPVSRVPQSPEPLLGIANLRGSVLPVVTLRGLQGMVAQSIASTARAIVLDVGAPVALVVDSVDALIEISLDGVDAQQADLGAEPGENLIGAFRTGAGQNVAKIIDIRRLLDAAFAQRARREKTVRRKGGDAQREATAEERAPAEMLVTFDVAGQEFALDLNVVQEILAAPATLTAVPRAEALVLGMTAVRETLLPLVSLRALLGFPLASGFDGREKVVVMRIGGAQVGLVADQARAIVAAAPAQIDPLPPVLAARVGGEARIRGIYRAEAGRRLISILASDQLFREDVMQRLNGAGKQPAQPLAAEAAQANEIHFLVFRLGEDEYGLPIEAVVEVAQVPEQITRLPKTPKFLEGVINLRGEVLPVIDQRRRFDIPATQKPSLRRLIVVKTERHRAGVIVDGVSDVLRISADSVEPAPDLTDETGRLVRGVINLEQSGRMVLLLDPTELLTRAERGLLDAFQAEAGRAKV